jgi:hypothetical protein
MNSDTVNARFFVGAGAESSLKNSASLSSSIAVAGAVTGTAGADVVSGLIADLAKTSSSRAAHRSATGSK